MNIGQNIANFRKENHITQEQLGEAVGVTNRTVSKWESGVSSPGIDLIPSIASALGITLDQLFEIEKTEKTDDNSQIIKETISSSIKEYLEQFLPNTIEDILEDTLEETLSKLLPQYLDLPENKDDYSLLVISPDKSKVCRFYGQGQIAGPYTFNNIPEHYSLTIQARGKTVFISDYDTKGAAAEALEAIFNAYKCRYISIEL